MRSSSVMTVRTWKKASDRIAADYTDLFAESILTATAGEDIYIVEKAGNINVNHLL